LLGAEILGPRPGVGDWKDHRGDTLYSSFLGKKGRTRGRMRVDRGLIMDHCGEKPGLTAPLLGGSESGRSMIGVSKKRGVLVKTDKGSKKKNSAVDNQVTLNVERGGDNTRSDQSE